MTQRIQYRIETPRASIAVEEVGRGSPILFIHSGSTSRAVFAKQFESRLAEEHRLIAFDLPGHGASSDAYDPTRTYVIPGLANTVLDLIAYLGLSDIILVGWSLGGEIAIEVASRFDDVRALVLSGTAPAALHYTQGLKPPPRVALSSKTIWSADDASEYISTSLDTLAVPLMRQSAVRTDARFREILVTGMRDGLSCNQREVVQNSPFPIAVINGADDPIIDLDYVDSLVIPNLWARQCLRIRHVGHAPHWSAPDVFNQLLRGFAHDLNEGYSGYPKYGHMANLWNKAG
jgi:pimeloyl-ACP methyl ester carboxylesterase